MCFYGLVEVAVEVDDYCFTTGLRKDCSELFAAAAARACFDWLLVWSMGSYYFSSNVRRLLQRPIADEFWMLILLLLMLLLLVAGFELACERSDWCYNCFVLIDGLGALGGAREDDADIGCLVEIPVGDSKLEGKLGDFVAGTELLAEPRPFTYCWWKLCLLRRVSAGELDFEVIVDTCEDIVDCGHYLALFPCNEAFFWSIACLNVELYTTWLLAPCCCCGC